jgi:hypothetical protein
MCKTRKEVRPVRIRLPELLFGMLLISGCAAGRLYPVQGPFSTESPVPVFTAKASGMFKSGSISVVLENGEKCKGRWVTAQAAPASTGAPTANSSTTSDMASVWDTVYGPGFYVSHVLGSRLFARAEVSGDSGTVIHMEMYRSEGEHDENAALTIRGIGRDNKDNIYKVVF